jgi:hypothetical protein
MDTTRRVPREGDRIQIAGFLGVFEVVGVREGGTSADLKHLSMECWDYTEEDLLSKETVYMNPPQPGVTQYVQAAEPLPDSSLTGASGVFYRLASWSGRSAKTPQHTGFEALPQSS